MNTTTNTRGVSEAMVDGPALLQIARDVGLREVMFNVSAERAIPLLQAFFSAALEAAPPAQPAAQGEAWLASPWLPIDQLPESDDLFWFLRGDTVDGPRPPQFGGYDADEWDYFAPCVEPPTERAAPPAQPAERLPEALPIYEKLDAHLSENSRG